MPIPTRSQSVRTSSKDVPETANLPVSGNPAGVNFSQGHSASRIRSFGGRAHPSDIYRPASHARSSSTTTSSLPRLRPAQGNTPDSQVPSNSRLDSASQRSSQQQSSSTLPSLGHTRSQSSSVIATGKAVGKFVSSARTAEKGLLHRPAFNAYQQHYSPKKVEPAVRTQSSASENLNWDLSRRLQDELLQLSLVHQESAITMRSLEKTAKGKVDTAKIKLGQEREIVVALEAELQQRINISALSAWLHEEGAELDERKIKTLSFCLSEMADLSDDGRVIEQIKSEFSRWLDKAKTTIASQRFDTSDLSNNAEILITDSPGEVWSFGLNRCLDRLELCHRLLEDLGDADSRSGLGQLLGNHRRLAAVMLEELRLSRDIVAKVLINQQQHLSSSLDVALAEAAEADDSENRQGLWTSSKFRIRI